MTCGTASATTADTDEATNAREHITMTATIPSSNAGSARVVGMRRTVVPAADVGAPRPSPAGNLRVMREGRDARLARKLGISLPLAGKLLTYAGTWTAGVIEVLLEDGDLPGVGNIMAPVDGSLAGRSLASATEAILKSVMAENAENAAEAAFMLDPTPENAKRLRRAGAHERLCEEERDRKIAEEVGL